MLPSSWVHPIAHLPKWIGSGDMYCARVSPLVPLAS
uniref:Uncharacterized protein n=1 Tax=Arundo donax TaxID=35708 RepID=A0A0A9H0B0_ARUDO